MKTLGATATFPNFLFWIMHSNFGSEHVIVVLKGDLPSS